MTSHRHEGEHMGPGHASRTQHADQFRVLSRRISGPDTAISGDAPEHAVIDASEQLADFY